MLDYFLGLRISGSFENCIDEQLKKVALLLIFIIIKKRQQLVGHDENNKLVGHDFPLLFPLTIVRISTDKYIENRRQYSYFIKIRPKSLSEIGIKN